MSGVTRSALGLPPGTRVPAREGRVAGAQQWDLVFDLDVGVPGYGWRFPCVDEGRAAESCGVFAVERGARVDAALRRFTFREELSPAVVRPSAVRLYEPDGPCGVGRALLAGEVLGADPLLGEGIRYAFWSGRLAGELSAHALARDEVASPAVYRARLLASRSGVLLALSAHLARRLYGRDERWQRYALDVGVARGVAALISGAAPAGPLLGLLGRLAQLAQAR